MHLIDTKLGVFVEATEGTSHCGYSIWRRKLIKNLPIDTQNMNRSLIDFKLPFQTRTMRGYSRYLRWAPLYTCCCLFMFLSSTVIAGKNLLFIIVIRHSPLLISKYAIDESTHCLSASYFPRIVVEVNSPRMEATAVQSNQPPPHRLVRSPSEAN